MTDGAYSLPAVSVGPAAMPLLGLGTWPLSDADVIAAAEVALETGYRHLDTATMYGNEAGIGRALTASGVPRADVFVTTKLPPDHAGRERQTLEESLGKLGLDHVDLWLVHWPPADGVGASLWEEFARARQDGLATSIGVSNYSLEQVDELTRSTGVAPEVDQIRWGPLLYDPEVVSGLQSRGVVLEGYSPLKASDLEDPTLLEIAASHDTTPAQVIIAWHIAHGFVVIPKSARPDRIIGNAEAIRMPLTVEQVGTIDRLSTVA